MNKLPKEDIQTVGAKFFYTSARKISKNQCIKKFVEFYALMIWSFG